MWSCNFCFQKKKYCKIYPLFKYTLHVRHVYALITENRLSCLEKQNKHVMPNEGQ
jgi:hypothetical protein